MLDEIMPKVINNLDLQSLVKCRLVSKRFRYFVDMAKIVDMVVASRPVAESKKNWFLTKEVIEIDKIAISPKAFSGYKLAFNLNSHLKRLCLNLKNELTLDLAVLNQMQIEQLDLKYGTLGSNQSVRLPVLKILELMMVGPKNYANSVFIQAPQLAKM